MERRTDSPFPRRDTPLVVVVGVLMFVPIVLLLLAEQRHDWRWYQREFRGLVTEKYGADKAATIPVGLQQIWVPALRRADRCVTCHQGIRWKGFEEADHPFRTHSAELLAAHPEERFGCTACHGGQGYAVSADAAHGPIQYWEEPVLGAYLGETYSLAAEKAAMGQMQCNVCHRFDRETRGAPEINRAKALVQEKGCRACHVINGRGGSIGPDLTTVGEKAPEQYDYGRLSGQKTMFAWHVAHLKDPRALVPETVMPNFHFTTRDAQALTMLAMSWKRVELPAEYVAGAPKKDSMTPEEAESEAKMLTGPGAWFVKTGCFVCHSITVFDVRSPAQIGPDLSTAVEDVQSRFGVTIDTFLHNPTGTMSVVLSRQIILTKEQKDFAIQKLRDAFAEHQRRGSAVPKQTH